MTDQLKNWNRPHYCMGGGDPFLFYVVYGSVPTDFKISQSKYHFSGIPDGVELMTYGPHSNPEIPGSFREGYLWDELSNNDAQLAKLVAAQDECLILRGTVEDPADLNYFRNVVGLVQWLIDTGGVAVYDPQSFKWWAARDWHDSAFVSDSGSPRQHVVILMSEADDGEWFHTRGLRKYGRPDLSIHRVPPESRDAVAKLLNRLIEFQAFGGVIEDGEAVRSNALPDEMTCHHRGDFEDPDFNNTHIEITWPD
ncbi:MAG: hypothetical protein K0U72_02905 [Gammaproteobacteria bacterium]|nr:hypothetical protein [Gammaproteobacteria bacterium]